jgi:hypothetical protein
LLSQGMRAVQPKLHVQQGVAAGLGRGSAACDGYDVRTRAGERAQPRYGRPASPVKPSRQASHRRRRERPVKTTRRKHWMNRRIRLRRPPPGCNVPPPAFPDRPVQTRWLHLRATSVLRSLLRSASSSSCKHPQSVDGGVDEHLVGHVGNTSQSPPDRVRSGAPIVRPGPRSRRCLDPCDCRTR